MYQRWVQTHQQYIHWLGQKIVAEANENKKIKKKTSNSNAITSGERRVKNFSKQHYFANPCLQDKNSL